MKQRKNMKKKISKYNHYLLCQVRWYYINMIQEDYKVDSNNKMIKKRLNRKTVRKHEETTQKVEKKDRDRMQRKFFS